MIVRHRKIKHTAETTQTVSTKELGRDATFSPEEPAIDERKH